MKACTQTIGRRYPEEGGLSDPFEDDDIRILESLSYRRLASKRQVLPIAENSHNHTRGVHTNEVKAITKRIARELGLSTSLSTSISDGHDIGHPPYGHSGERILTKLGGFKDFKHSVNSVVILQHIENEGKGLNLTYETLEGILKHSRGDRNIERNVGHEEYNVVMLADKIAYTFSDFDDAVRHEYLPKERIPNDFLKFLGRANQRKNECIRALIEESKEAGTVQFSQGPAFHDFERQRMFNYIEVYPKIDAVILQEYVLQKLGERFAKDSDFAGVDPILAVSLMTDTEVDHYAKLLYSYPTGPPKSYINHYGIFELLPYLRGKKIDYTDPDLKWGEELMRANVK